MPTGRRRRLSRTVDMIETPAQPARPATALVRFTPGARTNWHSHANGHTLCITECRLPGARRRLQATGFRL
ncbi:hypothetical protein [Streptomyces sp. NPDC086766]|uniref:hypothetical protein n=1 Tax=Streptomyces sp. NPDC086766 TaxID=3365754 RepID=UPI00381A97F7